MGYSALMHELVNHLMAMGMFIISGAIAILTVRKHA